MSDFNQCGPGVRPVVALLVLLLFALAGCDRAEPESTASTSGLEQSASQTACDDYRKAVRSTCLESYAEGLPVSCHRITTRANAAIAGDNQELCASNHEALKAERAKKLEHAKDVTLGEACTVFLEKFDDVCLGRLGTNFPAQCGGVMVMVGEMSGDSEEACRGSATILGRL